jgi:hypothetical protein
MSWLYMIFDAINGMCLLSRLRGDVDTVWALWELVFFFLLFVDNFTNQTTIYHRQWWVHGNLRRSRSANVRKWNLASAIVAVSMESGDLALTRISSINYMSWITELSIRHQAWCLPHTNQHLCMSRSKYMQHLSNTCIFKQSPVTKSQYHHLILYTMARNMNLAQQRCQKTFKGQERRQSSPVLSESASDPQSLRKRRTYR